MFRLSFFALMLPFFGGVAAQARPVARPMPPFLAAGAPDYMVFRTVDSTIDCQTMNGPFFAGNFVSEAATIEVESNAGIQLSYSNGTDLKSGQSTISTTFEFSLLGPASFDGKMASNGNDYTAFGVLPARKSEQSGIIEFPPTMVPTTKGVKARVTAQRRGLQDHAGKYQTEIVLSWARF